MKTLIKAFAIAIALFASQANASWIVYSIGNGSMPDNGPAVGDACTAGGSQAGKYIKVTLPWASTTGGSWTWSSTADTYWLCLPNTKSNYQMYYNSYQSKANGRWNFRNDTAGVFISVVIRNNIGTGISGYWLYNNGWGNAGGRCLKGSTGTTGYYNTIKDALQGMIDGTGRCTSNNSASHGKTSPITSITETTKGNAI